MVNIWWLLLFLAVNVSTSPTLSTSIEPFAGDYTKALTRFFHNPSKPLGASQCFSQRQPYDIQLKPITYAHCIEAARKVAIGDKAGAPMHFSRDPDAGMGLPEEWAYGNCVVRIDMREPGDEDTFNLYTVSNAASLIAQRCTAREMPGLGGLGLIGPKKVVMMIVYGRLPGPPPKPRPTIAAGVETA